jgi:hypothetical protein
MTAYGPSFSCSALAHLGQPAVSTVTHRDHEVRADEDHDLAAFHDLAGQHHRFVRDVVDGFEYQEQRVVVSLQLGPLMCAYRVFDGQRVQPENVGYFLHLA